MMGGVNVEGKSRAQDLQKSPLIHLMTSRTFKGKVAPNLGKGKPRCQTCSKSHHGCAIERHGLASNVVK